MKTETKHLILSPEQSLVEEMAKPENQGWKFKRNRMAIVVELEREIPEPVTRPRYREIFDAGFSTSQVEKVPDNTAEGELR